MGARGGDRTQGVGDAEAGSAWRGDDRGGISHHRRRARRGGGDPHQGGRLHDHLGRASRARRRARRGAGEARRKARRHGCADAVQPPGVSPVRPRGDDARRDAVLDLHDLHAGADPLPDERCGCGGPDLRAAVPCARARGARVAAGPQPRDRRGRGGSARDARAVGGRGLEPGLRRRRLGGGDPVHRRADADLHLRDDRAAEGRAADSPQPVCRGGGCRGAGQIPARRPGDLVAARRTCRRAQRPPLPADRLRPADHLLR